MNNIGFHLKFYWFDCNKKSKQFFLSIEAIFICINIEEVDIESFIKKLKEKQKEAIKTTCKYIDLVEMKNIYLADYFWFDSDRMKKKEKNYH